VTDWFVSDIAIFVLKRDVKLQLTDWLTGEIRFPSANLLQGFHDYQTPTSVDGGRKHPLGLLVSDRLLITGPLPAATNHSSDLVPSPHTTATAAADKTLMLAALLHNI